MNEFIERINHKKNRRTEGSIKCNNENSADTEGPFISIHNSFSIQFQHDFISSAHFFCYYVQCMMCGTHFYLFYPNQVISYSLNLLIFDAS